MEVRANGLPFSLETDLEESIAARPEWREGLRWGEPREGHPEGSVGRHIADVLDAVENMQTSDSDRTQLRLAALVHDSFKYLAPERSAPVASELHHGAFAARFLDEFVDDEGLVLVVRWHDEAFSAWLSAHKRGDWTRAETRAHALIDRLGTALPLYERFFAVDNATPGKSAAPIEWFTALAHG